MYSQNCNHSLEGYVLDFHNGEPIAGATLQIENSQLHTISDSNGKFIINNLCESSIELIVSHVACDQKTVEIDIKNNIQTTIYLEHHIEELEMVAIKGNNSNNGAISAQKEKIDKKIIDNFSSESLGTILKQAKGVSSISTGNKIVKPVINGLHSSRIAIMNNNVRMEDQEWGIEHAPNIDVNAIDNITVIKGSNALAYAGDAIGGIVVLKPLRYLNKDTLYGKTITGFQSNGLGYNLNSMFSKNFKNGWFANGNVGYKQNGDLKSPDYNLTNTGAKSFSGSVIMGYQKFEYGFEANLIYIDNTMGILSASHIGNIGDLVNSIDNEEPRIINDFSYTINSPKQEVSHLLGKINFYKRFSALGKLSIQYDYQNNHRFEFDKRIGDDRNKPAVDLELITQNLKSDLMIDKFDNSTIYLGVTGKYQENIANPETGVRRLIPDYEKMDVSIYGIWNTTFNDKLKTDFGVRYDYNFIDAQKYYKTSRWEERGYSEDFSDFIVDDLGTQLLTNPIFTYHNISLSAGLIYSVNKNNDLIFNYGLSSRPPNPSELFSDGLHHSAARIELGDLRLTKEISNRVGLSYQLEANRINLSLDTFINQINDFIYLKPTGTQSTIRGAFPVWEYFKTNALLAGIDTSIDYQFTELWSLNSSFSYVYGQNTEEDIPLIDIPAFKLNNALNYKLKKWNHLNVRLAHEWIGRQNRYPNYNFETYIPTTGEYVEVDISTPPDAFQLIHLFGDVTFLLNQELNLNLMIGIMNLFNTNYREYLNRLRYYADDTGRNITIQIKFNY
jgi:iron complex outermembrane receptor protein